MLKKEKDNFIFQGISLETSEYIYIANAMQISLVSSVLVNVFF